METNLKLYNVFKLCNEETLTKIFYLITCLNSNLIQFTIMFSRFSKYKLDLTEFVK